MALIAPVPAALNGKPSTFALLHTAFVPHRLPALPRVTDPTLVAALGKLRFLKEAFPNVQELALLGDAALRMVIMERIQGLGRVGHNGDISTLCARLNTNNVFSYLCLAYQLLPTTASDIQKSFADIFEAHIGALWRETELDPMARARLTEIIRQIFSPEVFPVLARWEKGDRDSTVQRTKSKRDGTTRVFGGNTQAKAMLMGAAGSKKKKSRSSGAATSLKQVAIGTVRDWRPATLPRGDPITGFRPSTTKLPTAQEAAKRIPGGDRYGTRHSRAPEMVDLTLYDSDDDEDDDDDFEIIDAPPPVSTRPRQSVTAAGPSRATAESCSPPVINVDEIGQTAYDARAIGAAYPSSALYVRSSSPDFPRSPDTTTVMAGSTHAHQARAGPSSNGISNSPPDFTFASGPATAAPVICADNASETGSGDSDAVSRMFVRSASPELAPPALKQMVIGGLFLDVTPSKGKNGASAGIRYANRSKAVAR